MNNLEAIVERISRRTYLGEPIDESSQIILNDLIKIYNTSSGMTSFLLKDGSKAFDSFSKCYGLFKNVVSLIILKGPKSDLELKEKTGYYGQRLILKATQLGLGTCWVGGTFKRDDILFHIQSDEECYCVITIGKVSSNLSMKDRFISGLIHRKTKTVDNFYESDVIFDNLPDYFVMGYKAISKAPTALNAQKVKAYYKDGITSIGVPDTSKFDMVDLGIAKANFELAAGGAFPLGNHVSYIKEM